MIIYETIYPFRVAEKICAGERVWMLDRQTRTVEIASNKPAVDVLKALNADDEENRYEFWVEKEEPIERENTEETKE